MEKVRNFPKTYELHFTVIQIVFPESYRYSSVGCGDICILPSDGSVTPIFVEKFEKSSFSCTYGIAGVIIDMGQGVARAKCLGAKPNFGGLKWGKINPLSPSRCIWKFSWGQKNMGVIFLVGIRLYLTLQLFRLSSNTSTSCGIRLSVRFPSCFFLWYVFRVDIFPYITFT